MANIPDGSFQDWQDTQTIHAAEYKQEREMMRAAINDNDNRLKTVETNQQGTITGIRSGTAFPTDPAPKVGDLFFRTDTGTPYEYEATGWKALATQAWVTANAQMSKITNDVGGVSLSASTTADDILAMIVNAGVGYKTFYAITGSKNLPPSGISIRGESHITGVNPTNGWVQAYDYNGASFTNYISNGVWTGWKSGGLLTKDGILNLTQQSSVTASIAFAKTVNSGTPLNIYFDTTYRDTQGEFFQLFFRPKETGLYYINVYYSYDATVSGNNYMQVHKDGAYWITIGGVSNAQLGSCSRVLQLNAGVQYYFYASQTSGVARQLTSASIDIQKLA